MRGAADTDGRLVVAILALSVAGLTTTSSGLRKAIFAPLAALSIYLVLFTASDDLPTDYFVGCSTMINLFRMSDLLLLSDPQKELHRQGETMDVSRAPFLSRLKWALSLYASLRGVSWSHEPTSHLPPSSKTTRTRFVLSQLLVLAQAYFVFNFGNLLVLLNSSYSKNGPPFSSQPWWLRPTAIGQTLQVNGFLNGLYIVCSILGVVLHLSAPKDWPALFGPVSGACTVRKICCVDRRVWHQILRKFLTGHGNAFAKALRLPRGRVKTYFCLYTAFFISGLIHYFGDFMIIQDWSGGSLIYFTSQACAITFEDAVQGLVRMSGVKVPRTLSRAVGYLWVVAWFSFAIPIWMEPHVKAGITSEGVTGSSVVPMLAKGIASRLRLEVR